MKKFGNLPLWEEYSKDIKSKIADVKNLGRSRIGWNNSWRCFP